MSKKKIGAPKRRFDEEVIAELVDRRIKEQIPWKSLPDVYMELLPEDSKEKIPDWRTLRNALMEDVDAAYMPTRVSRKMRTRMVQEFDKADLAAMMMTVLTSRYGEWNLLHNRMLKNAAAAGLEDDDEEKLEVPKFTQADRDRMDFLAGETYSVVIKIAELMKTMHIEDNSLFRLVESAGGTSPQVKGYNEDAKAIESAVASVVDQVKKSSADMLAEINESHRVLGVGHYRVREEPEPDLLEET